MIILMIVLLAFLITSVVLSLVLDNKYYISLESVDIEVITRGVQMKNIVYLLFGFMFLNVLGQLYIVLFEMQEDTEMTILIILFVLVQLMLLLYSFISSRRLKKFYRNQSRTQKLMPEES